MAGPCNKLTEEECGDSRICRWEPNKGRCGRDNRRKN
eukprot:UN01857